MMKIIITGASSGLGARLFEDLTECERWGVARRMRTAPPGTRYTTCDLSEWVLVEELVRTIASTWKTIDAVIHCAGIHGEIAPVLIANPKRWSESIRSNLDAGFFIARAFGPLLASGGTGQKKMVFFSGGGASKARPNFTAYASAKTALVRMVETIAEEWRSLPIDINIVAPGAFSTQLTHEIVAAGEQMAGSKEYAEAQKRLKEGGDDWTKLLKMIRFLISRDSDGLSGRFVSAQWDAIEDLKRAKGNKEAFVLRRMTDFDSTSIKESR